MSQRAVFQGLVYYKYHSTLEGVPLIIIHGHGGDHHGLEKMVQLLDRPVYAPDLPGFGESKELEKHTIEAYVNSLIDLANHLQLIEYDLAGHSLGSAVALAVATRDKRVQKLVLLDPIPTFRTIIKRMLKTVHGVSRKIPQSLAHRFIHAGVYNLATFLLHSSQRKDVTLARNYLQSQSRVTYSVRAWSESGEAIYNLDQMELATKIKAPTLILHGNLDKMTTLASIHEFQARFHNAELYCDNKSGHFMPLEHPELTAQVISEFL